MREGTGEKFSRRRRGCLLFVLAFCLAVGMIRPVTVTASQKATQKIRVLLVGNSYTKYNDLAGMLTKIGKSCGVRITVKTIARGKAKLSDYADKKSALGKWFRKWLKSGDWDYVILQDRRLRPLTDADDMQEDAVKLCNLIRKANAIPMLYMTWAPQEGHRDYRNYSSLVSSRTEYQKKVTAVYTKIGKVTGAQVIPAGLAVLQAEKEFPKLSFQKSDGHHPNKKGSYVVACTMFSAITGKSAYGKSTYTAGISKKTAMEIQHIAWKYAKEYASKTGKRKKS